MNMPIQIANINSILRKLAVDNLVTLNFVKGKNYTKMSQVNFLG